MLVLLSSWLRRSGAILLALGTSLSTFAQPATAAWSLDNVRTIHAERGETSAPLCLRTEGKRIAATTDAGAADCVRDSQVQDLTGRYVMPGLIDMHAHLTLGPLELQRVHGEASLVALPDNAIARHNAQRLVAFGVTTIRNPAGDLAAATRYKQKRASGEWIGPESFDAGPVINNADIEGLSVTVRTPDEMRTMVADQVAAGADWIKLYTGLSPELLQAGIDAAHAHDRPAVAHLDAIAWPDALAMGLDGLVHLMPVSPDLLDDNQRKAWQAATRPGTFVFFDWWEHFDPDGPHADRLIAAFDRHRPVFDATLVAFHAAFVQDLDQDQGSPYKDDTRRYAHPRLRQNWEEFFTFAIGWEADDFRPARAIWPKVQRMAQRIYASEARVTVGTDMGNPWIAPGISLHREMALLGEAGVPNARVLQAATVNAADALGIGERTGRIRRGYEADLLVLDGNPLERLAHTRAIHSVVVDGAQFSLPQLSALKEEQP